VIVECEECGQEWNTTLGSHKCPGSIANRLAAKRARTIEECAKVAHEMAIDYQASGDLQHGHACLAVAARIRALDSGAFA